jgi:spore coat assembly protein
MNNLKVGDIVARKSYGGDIYFKVAEIRHDGKENIATLKGICYRIQADAPESDLMLINDQRVRDHKMRADLAVSRKYREIQGPDHRFNSKKFSFRNTPKENTRKFIRPGNVLHIDGDNEYMQTCLEQYRKFGIEAVGRHVIEQEQASVIYGLLQQYRPDILVLTGHDGMLKGESSYSSVKSYSTSNYFIEAVKEARRYSKNLDGLVIFAGACQSMYNELISAGANFASSPFRVLIHALDPVFVSQKIAFTSIEKVLDPSDVINNTITGAKGIGGLQTRGKFRNGFPLEPAR